MIEIVRKYPFKHIQLFLAEALIAFKFHRVQPEFGLLVVALDMQMSKLATVARVEEKSKRSIAKGVGMDLSRT